MIKSLIEYSHPSSWIPFQGQTIRKSISDLLVGFDWSIVPLPLARLSRMYLVSWILRLAIWMCRPMKPIHPLIYQLGMLFNVCHLFGLVGSRLVSGLGIHRASSQTASSLPCTLPSSYTCVYIIIRSWLRDSSRRLRSRVEGKSVRVLFFFSFSPLFSSIGCKTNIKSFKLDKDIHNRLMSAYKEVPEWWSVVLSSRRWTPASSYPLRDPSGISSSSSLHWSQGLYTISNMILATPFGHSLWACYLVVPWILSDTDI